MKPNTNNQLTVALQGPEIQCEDLAKQLARKGVNYILLRKPPCNPLKYLAWLPYFFCKTAQCDILHILLPTTHLKTAKLGILKRMPIICHWIGTDVLKLQTKKVRKRLLRICNHGNVTHLAISKHLIDELAEYEIHAELIKNISERINTKVEALPERHAVLSYWPDERAEFYGASKVFELARRFPQIPFLIIAATGAGQEAPANIRFLGKVKDIHSIFLQTTIYVRIVAHDGGDPPRTVSEALARGRYVLYNRPHPYCEYGETIDELQVALNRLLRKKEPNHEGAVYIQTHINIDQNTTELLNIYEEILNARS